MSFSLSIRQTTIIASCLKSSAKCFLTPTSWRQILKYLPSLTTLSSKSVYFTKTKLTELFINYMYTVNNYTSLYCIYTVCIFIFTT